jgi:photosystem II stability/assembly factor-like uncharacterized protein
MKPINRREFLKMGGLSIASLLSIGAFSSCRRSPTTQNPPGISTGSGITAAPSTTLVETSTAPTTFAPPPSIDWSQISIPSSGPAGRGVLTPGKANLQNAVFSIDGRSIFGIGSNSRTFLGTSADGGRTWEALPAFEELGLCEAFFMKMAGEELFIGSSTYGLFRSSDGGKTITRMPAIVADPGVWQFDATVDGARKPLIIAGIGNGLWKLAYPYERWEDLRVCNRPSGGSGYFVWQMAFSPHYLEDGQIVALIGDGQHLWVSFKYGDEDWGKRTSDAPIPGPGTFCDLNFTFTRFAFPDDYNARAPVVYIGAGLNTEIICRTPELAGLYRIDGKPVGGGPSAATNLNVGGKGAGIPISSLAVRGPAGSAYILAGGASQVYHSTDGGQSWLPAKKPPTGSGPLWLAFDPVDGQNRLSYAITSWGGSNMVPRGVLVPVEEGAFSYSADGGITWNQISRIDTTIDEVIGRAVSPAFQDDKTLFMLTCSHHLLTPSINADEMITVTRKPDQPGVSATVYITPHQGNPPMEQMRITSGDPAITRLDFDTGTGADFVLNDAHPSATIRVLPQTEARIKELAKGMAGWLPQYADPWYCEQWLALIGKPRQVCMFLLDGAVTVSRGEAPKLRITIDGNPDDWQGIEPLISDAKDSPLMESDFKALYVSNDDLFLYLMLEFYGPVSAVHCEIMADFDLDGTADHIMYLWSPLEMNPPQIHIKPLANAKSEDVIVDIAAFNSVIETRLSLSALGIKKFVISDIQVRGLNGKEYTPILDGWQGSAEIEVKELPLPPPGESVPFPSSESVWKTTDSGATWERILTSGLIMAGRADNKVGALVSVSLSPAYPTDHTVSAHESGGKVWVSHDSGATFALQ